MRAVSAIRNLFSFPLLAKELTEAAARRRTYVMRVVYGLLLFVTIGLWMPRVNAFEGEDLMHMGAGLEIFEKLILLQFVCLALFLPALMSGSITHEKERDSLVWLLLTELRLWSIVLQKYAGGLVPVLSFLLIAMPCMAVAYAFGGLSWESLLWSSIALLLTAFQIGALSLMLSAWCRTTVGAFIGTYFWTVALYAGPPLAMALWQGLRSAGAFDDKVAFLLVPAHILENGVAVRFQGGNEKFLVLLHVALGLASTLIFLSLARFFLVRRAFLPATSVFLRLFRILDRLMKWANRFAGNFVLVRESATLPDEEPVAWRETSRRALGKTVYLFRILMAVEIPVLLICWAAVFTSVQRERCEGLSVLAAVIGAFGVLALGAQSANTIVSERIQQTLEVLLTTPLAAAEIVRQKARALRRVMLILAIPLLTIFAAKCWIEHGAFSEAPEGLFLNDHALMYGVCAVLALSIFLPLASWLALWIGLKVRTRFKAIVVALAAIGVWCALPYLVLSFIRLDRPTGFTRYASLKAIELLSPLSIVAANESGEVSQFGPVTTLMREIALQDFTLYEVETDWYGQTLLGANEPASSFGARNHGPPPSAWPIVMVTFACYAFLLWLIWRQALRHADFYLRR